MSKNTVFIVDDDVELCRSIQWLLDSVNLASKVFNHGSDFLKNFKPEQSAGCLLLDIRMAGLGGLELQEELNVRNNTLPIIFMTGHGDVPMAVRAMKAGAFEFLTKPFNNQILLELINKAIIHNEKFRSLNQKTAEIQERLNSLTPREKEVLKLIIAGKLNKEVAYDFNVSLKTIELHRSHVMKKMQASTTAELVKFYMSSVEGRNELISD